MSLMFQQIQIKKVTVQVLNLTPLESKVFLLLKNNIFYCNEWRRDVKSKDSSGFIYKFHPSLFIQLSKKNFKLNHIKTVFFSEQVLLHREDGAQPFSAAASLMAAKTLLSSSLLLLARMCVPNLFLMSSGAL